jgi:hypothetical protein
MARDAPIRPQRPRNHLTSARFFEGSRLSPSARCATICLARGSPGSGNTTMTIHFPHIRWPASLWFPSGEPPAGAAIGASHALAGVILFLATASTGCRVPPAATERSAAPRTDAPDAAPSAVVSQRDSGDDAECAFDAAQWVDQARTRNAPRTREPGCTRLVYKRGCAETRTGSVSVRVTIEPGTGRVRGVTITGHTIQTDPEPMLRCVSDGLARWTFTPSPGAPTSFEMTFRYSTKC